jgi:hypothetical protein
VEESELIIFFFEGVLAGVGKACSAEVWGMWCADFHQQTQENGQPQVFC